MTAVDQVIVRRPDGSMIQQPMSPASSPMEDLLPLESLLEGSPEEGWTLLKVEIDPGSLGWEAGAEPSAGEHRSQPEVACEPLYVDRVPAGG